MWKKIDRKTLLEHQRLTVFEDIVELPAGNRVSYLVFETTKLCAQVICMHKGKVLVAQEYSYPPNVVLYQFPGGAAIERETAVQTAKRELAEEVGLSARQFDEIGWYYVDNRRTNRKMHVFVAQDCYETEATEGDKEESIQHEWMPIEEIDTLIAKNIIVNPSFLAAWAIFGAKRRTNKIG